MKKPKTADIAHAFRKAAQKAWTVEQLRLWAAREYTGESGWYLRGETPEFMRIAARVLAYYRRHGWVERNRQVYSWIVDEEGDRGGTK